MKKLILIPSLCTMLFVGACNKSMESVVEPPDHPYDAFQPPIFVPAPGTNHGNITLTPQDMEWKYNIASMACQILDFDIVFRVSLSTKVKDGEIFDNKDIVLNMDQSYRIVTTFEYESDGQTREFKTYHAITSDLEFEKGTTVTMSGQITTVELTSATCEEIKQATVKGEQEFYPI